MADAHVSTDDESTDEEVADELIEGVNPVDLGFAGVAVTVLGLDLLFFVKHIFFNSVFSMIIQYFTALHPVNQY